MESMGICMKDHPADDVREKLEDVKEFLASATVEELLLGLSAGKWDQSILNELFHDLKKLEKNITEEEREQVIVKIGQYI